MVAMGVSVMFGALSLFLVLIGVIGYLIYQAASDNWDMQLLQAWSRQLPDPRPDRP